MADLRGSSGRVDIDMPVATALVVVFGIAVISRMVGSRCIALRLCITAVAYRLWEMPGPGD